MPVLLHDPSLGIALGAGYKCVACRAPTLGQELSPSLFVGPDKRDNAAWIQYKGSVIEKMNKVTSFANGNSFDIPQYVNCNSCNIIYVIKVNTWAIRRKG